MRPSKAYRWQEQIESSEYADLEDLAKGLKLDCSYVVRMLRPPSLAPDIIETIVRGKEPDGISLRTAARQPAAVLAGAAGEVAEW